MPAQASVAVGIVGATAKAAQETVEAPFCAETTGATLSITVIL